jgi:NAD(P)H-hydrate repair Nnr-like enzyme with NAD(P)H-hydrate dehydratase domain
VRSSTAFRAPPRRQQVPLGLRARGRRRTGLTGAVCLSAEAAFRADAGYVTVCAPRESLPIVEMRLLEAVKRPLEEAFEAAKRASALALGPGLGRGDEARQLVRRLLEETDLPAVVDADGLFGFEPVERDPQPS